MTLTGHLTFGKAAFHGDKMSRYVSMLKLLKEAISISINQIYYEQIPVQMTNGCH